MHEMYMFASVFSCMHICVCCDVFQHSGHEFHEDLYPDTVGTTPAMSAEEWWQGGNKQVQNLHPVYWPIWSSHCTGASNNHLCLSSGGEGQPPPRQAAQTEGSTRKADACKEGAGEWGEQGGERHTRWLSIRNNGTQSKMCGCKILSLCYFDKLTATLLFYRIRLMAALPPAVLWAPPAAVLPRPALPPPPPASPRASSPAQVPAKAPRPSTACWVWTHTRTHTPEISLSSSGNHLNVLIHNYLWSRANLQVPPHPGCSDAPGHTHHQPAWPQPDYTRRVWRLLCQPPACGSAARHLRGPDRRLWGTTKAWNVAKNCCRHVDVDKLRLGSMLSVTFFPSNFKDFGKWDCCVFSSPVLSALSLADYRTQPCPPSRTL